MGGWNIGIMELWNDGMMEGAKRAQITQRTQLTHKLQFN
jgi:hypothetical protein